MPSQFSRIVDAVWSVAGDGFWHAESDLAEQLGFGAQEVAAAFDFLVRYGFARSSSTGERRFKMIVGAPSPMNAAIILEAAAFHPDLRLPHAEMS